MSGWYSDDRYWVGNASQMGGGDIVIDINGSVERGRRRRVKKLMSQKVRSILNESDSSRREESVAETLNNDDGISQLLQSQNLL